MNAELRTKTDQELCILVFRLKLQLLESRFMQQAGQLEKPHKLAEIRKTIAQAMTILSERQIVLSIGTHGITYVDKKNNKTVSINEEAAAVINSTKGESTTDKNTKQIINDTAKKVQKVEPRSNVKTESISANSSSVVRKDVKKSQNVVKKQAVRKTAGGGA
jgi:large subunit ribosomal protein L29